MAKKKQSPTCPVCNINLDGVNLIMHNYEHVKTSPDGHHHWQCSCGAQDGIWNPDSKGSASAGLTMHMYEKHGTPLG